MKRKAKPKTEGPETFKTDTHYIAVCGCDEWVFVSDNATKALEQLNDHLNCEHQGEDSAFTDSRIFKAYEQIELGLEVEHKLVLGRTR